MAEPAPRAWRVVLDRIEADLRDGRYGIGDRLPPERALAATLEVGRSSVREALRVLEVMGLIRTATGSGPASGAVIVATPHGGMAALLRLQVAAQVMDIDHIVQMRLILEEGAVAQLAHAEAELAEATATLDAMSAPGLSPDEFLALDAQFHVRLAEATGNPLVAATMAGLRTVIEDYVRSGAVHISDWDAVATALTNEHTAILEAIRQKDADTARTRVREHITGYLRVAGLTDSQEPA